MFEDKTLVVLGCSFAFGIFENDTGIKNITTCHERSWATKLGETAGFKNVVNLSLPGGSNYRSERVLVEYLRKNTKDIVVIFSLTELSRFETIHNLDIGVPMHISPSDIYGDYGYIDRSIDIDREDITVKDKQFLEYYYSVMHNDRADIEIINRNMLMIHCLLKSLNIEHYFFPMLCEPNVLIEEQLGFKIPLISFSDNGSKINAFEWLQVNKFKKGKCGHFDHDGNQFLAEYIYATIKEKL
jgi:hypothetical protein